MGAFFWSESSWIFLLTYGAGVTVVVLWSLYLSSGGWVFAANQRVYNRLLAQGALFYFAGFGLWNLENLHCDRMYDFHLHVFWHFLAPVGTLLYVFSFLVRSFGCGMRR